MAKAKKGELLGRMQSAARLARTDLAARLLTHGFYAGQDQIILALDENDGMAPGQLAARLGVRPPTITKTINRLQAQGFVVKGASDTDARMSRVFLTDKGRDAVESIEKAIRRSEKAALDGLDKKERKVLAKLLSRVEENLGAATARSAVSDETAEVEDEEEA